MTALFDPSTSTVTDDERSEDCSFLETNRPRRKWKKASDFNATWPAPTYEPNPSCLCDTCEKNYLVQLAAPWRTPPRRRYSDTSDEEVLTDVLAYGNENESCLGETVVSVDVRNNRRGFTSTRKNKGGTKVLSDKIPGDDKEGKMGSPAMCNTIQEISTLTDGRQERKPTKSESTEPEVEEESSDARANDTSDISSAESLEETETHNRKIKISCQRESETKHENRREKYKYERLKPLNETVKTEPNQTRLDMESDLQDGQNAAVQFTNENHEGTEAHLDKEDCGYELSEILSLQIDEQKKNAVDSHQKLVGNLGNVEGNDERPDEINSSNEPDTDGRTEREKATLLPPRDKTYSEKKTIYEDVCRACDKNVGYHLRKQIRERKRSGLSVTEGGKNEAQDLVPKTLNETSTALEVVENDLGKEIPLTRNSREKRDTPAGSVNGAAQDATAPENVSCMVMTLPQTGLHFTRGGHGYSQRVASASRRNLSSTGRGSVNCRRHIFCRRLQLNRNTSKTTASSRNLARRPLECSLRRSFRGLRASLGLGLSHGRRSLRALTFGDAVERETPVVLERELTVVTIGIIKLIFG
ncbi:uncharacterized protein LOC135224914 [Macrobrachium nipponense]|uniref:uncharacterized protein LOC135224914 n=1 Tax=Macrobrachium nipponense TaxID=159736 RepID=UPI0030C7F675